LVKIAAILVLHPGNNSFCQLYRQKFFMDGFHGHEANKLKQNNSNHVTNIKLFQAIINLRYRVPYLIA